MKALARGLLLMYKELLVISLLLPLSNLALAFVDTTNKIATSAKVTLSGEIKQGGFILGKTSSVNQVTFDGESLHLSEQGDFVFGFGRDDNKSHQLVITTPEGIKTSKTLTPSIREYKIQRIKGIAKKLCNPIQNQLHVQG